MATPPFNLSITSPSDTDLGRIYPADERSLRDKVQSWFLIDGNVNGGKEKISFTPQGASPAMAGGVVGLWANSVGRFFRRLGAGTAYEVGVLPGAVVLYGGSTLPDGYLWCNGASLLRTDYPDLWAAIGGNYGTVDGTHFSVPDLLERLPIGRGTMGGVADPARVTNAVSGFDPTALNGAGGDQSIVLDTNMIPAHTHTFAGSALGTHSHTFTGSALGNHTHGFTGNALGTHTHTFTGSALGTHGHTFSGSALAGHTHTFTGDALGTHTHTTSTISGSGPVNITAGAAAAFGFNNDTGAKISSAVSAGTPTGTLDSVSGGTPAGTNSATGAGTPAGTNSSDSAGTPSGTNANASAGTPAGTNSSDSAGTPAGTNSSTGGGLLHKNMPPVLVMNYIIKF